MTKKKQKDTVEKNYILKTDKNFRINRRYKYMLSTIIGDGARAIFKNMMIDAQLAEIAARQNPTKLQCSDGASMWAGGGSK